MRRKFKKISNYKVTGTRLLYIVPFACFDIIIKNIYIYILNIFTSGQIISVDNMHSHKHSVFNLVSDLSYNRNVPLPAILRRRMLTLSYWHLTYIAISFCFTLCHCLIINVISFQLHEIEIFLLFLSFSLNLCTHTHIHTHTHINKHT